MKPSVLVIRLGALGDFIQSSGPFAAIRRHHAGARITLLTTRPFKAFAEASPWFDEVWTDERPKLWQVGKLLDLRRKLRDGDFFRVYDLQTSDRSSSYFRLMGGKVEWSGIAKGCSHPHANPGRDLMHTIERQAEQLAMAGIAHVPAPDLSWVKADISRFDLPRPFALLCPGGAPHRPAKRWPAAHFGTLAQVLSGKGITPVLLGTGAEAGELDQVAAACPTARNLAGHTDLFDLASLGREAKVAIGNDTGPMHVISASGCASVVLFSGESDPNLCAPRGKVAVLRRADLGTLAPPSVEEALAALT